jgi:hypothetical protein
MIATHFRNPFHNTLNATWSRDDLRTLARRWRTVALLSWALLALVAVLDLLGNQPEPVAPPCRPIALSVVVGDTAEGDVAYILDSCGNTRRQPRHAVRDERQAARLDHARRAG